MTNSINKRLARLQAELAWEARGRIRREASNELRAALEEKYIPPIPNLEWSAGARKPRMAEDGYIYFVECQDFIKIGWTLQLEKRLSAIGVSVPFTLRLLHVSTGSEDDERSIHFRFLKHQHKGEWFRKVPELLEYIEDLKRNEEY